MFSVFADSCHCKLKEPDMKMKNDIWTEWCSCPYETVTITVVPTPPCGCCWYQQIFRFREIHALVMPCCNYYDTQSTKRQSMWAQRATERWCLWWLHYDATGLVNYSELTRARNQQWSQEWAGKPHGIKAGVILWLFVHVCTSQHCEPIVPCSN